MKVKLGSNYFENMLFPDFGWVDSSHKLYPKVVGISMDLYEKDYSLELGSVLSI